MIMRLLLGVGRFESIIRSYNGQKLPYTNPKTKTQGHGTDDGRGDAALPVLTDQIRLLKGMM